MKTLVYKFKMLEPKKALVAVALAGLVAAALSVSLALADGPKFNIFPVCYEGGVNCDLPMLDGRNATKNEGWSANQADHDAGVQAQPGDIMEFSIFYHNGATNSGKNTARNTVVKAAISPVLGEKAATHTVLASVGADNASTAFSALPHRGGNVKVHLQSGQSVSLVPGSVYLFKDQGLTPKAGPVQLPDTIFTSGVNIGDVRGCFEFHGFVNFKLRVSEDAVPVPGDLRVQKHVKNITQGLAFSDTEVPANPGDLVEYQILVNAVDNKLDNVKLRDEFDSRLSGTGGVFLDGVQMQGPTEFAAFEINLGSVTPGVSREVRFQARVAGQGSFAAGSHILNNRATAFTDTREAFDEAKVRVTVSPPPPQVVSCNVIWDFPQVSDNSGRGLRHAGEGFNADASVSGLSANKNFNFFFRHVIGVSTFRIPFAADGSGNFNGRLSSAVPASLVAGDYDLFVEADGANVATCRGMRVEGQIVQQLDLQKTVRNESTGTSFAKQASAKPLETVSFRLIVSPAASNTFLSNVAVRDLLPSGISYLSNTLTVNDSLRPDFEANQLFSSSGLLLGNLNAGSQFAIVFRGQVASSVSAGGTVILTNLGSVSAAGVVSRQDEAHVVVQPEPVLSTQFSLRKTAFNNTQGVDAVSAAANPGDVITYSLFFRNSGQTTIQDAVVEDDISDVLELAEIVDQGGAVSVNAVIRYAPVTVLPGQEVGRSFQVRVRDASLFPATSDLVMTNVYGNEIRIPVRKPQVLGVSQPPRTGPAEWVAVTLALATTVCYWFVRRNRRANLSPDTLSH